MGATFIFFFETTKKSWQHGHNLEIGEHNAFVLEDYEKGNRKITWYDLIETSIWHDELILRWICGTALFPTFVSNFN